MWLNFEWIDRHAYALAEVSKNYAEEEEKMAASIQHENKTLISGHRTEVKYAELDHPKSRSLIYIYLYFVFHLNEYLKNDTDI